MATLLKMKTAGGNQRFCSAKCYNAHGHDCTCICNGANHGVGPDKAAQNVQAISQELVRHVRSLVSREEAERLQTQADQLALQLY